jgi:hypothetical protein
MWAPTVGARSRAALPALGAAPSAPLAPLWPLPERATAWLWEGLGLLEAQAGCGSSRGSPAQLPSSSWIRCWRPCLRWGLWRALALLWPGAAQCWLWVLLGLWRSPLPPLRPALAPPPPPPPLSLTPPQALPAAALRSCPELLACAALQLWARPQAVASSSTGRAGAARPGEACCCCAAQCAQRLPWRGMQWAAAWQWQAPVMQWCCWAQLRSSGLWALQPLLPAPWPLT